jgi:hypothetical protein
MMVLVKTLTKEEHEELRRLLEETEVVSVSENIREYVEETMPDLIDRLPPRILH